MTQMVGNDPIMLAMGLGVLGLRAWLFGLPFIGLGVAWSQWTASPNWARVLAVGRLATLGQVVGEGVVHEAVPAAVIDIDAAA